MSQRKPSRPERRQFPTRRDHLPASQRNTSRRNGYKPNKNMGHDKQRLLVLVFGAVIGLLAVVTAVWFVLRGASGVGDEVDLVPPSTAVANIIPTVSVMPTAVLPTPTITVTNTPTNAFVSLPNFADLQQQLYTLINQSRAAANLPPIAWDTTATLAGRLHAEDMAQFNYFSHWNRDGLGPDHRYTLVGGQHAVMENLHAFSYTYDNGQGAPIENWPELIQNAHTGLMNSPGHRANILDPAHTHVGIGMAYNPQTGQFRLAQEFTNQYTRLEQPLPRQAQPADTITVRGQFVGNNLSGFLLQLAYEPFPQPMSLEELAQTNVYSSAAVDVETRRIDQSFAEIVPIPAGQPGFYHIRLFADINNQQALVLNHVLEVR